MDMYARHRRALMTRLPDGLIFVLGGVEQVRNHDVHYPFRQLSHFLYLTGIELPGFALLLNPARNDARLLIPRIDQRHRVWSGDVPGLSDSKTQFGIREVAYLDELPKFIKTRPHTRLYGDKRSLAALSKAGIAGIREAALFEDALSDLRVTKSDDELALLKQANDVSAIGHHMAMAGARSGVYEYQIQTVLEAPWRNAGLPHNAYPSIVAAGENSAVLHYHGNNARLKKGDLLLIDAGAECRGYAADITRTFPVSGTFTSRQRDVYTIVLETQTRCIAALKPGLSMLDLHLEAVRSIAEGLRSLRLLTGDVDAIIDSGAVKLFFPHGIGHTLGLDVHDVDGGKHRRRRKRRLPGDTALRFDRYLEPGFVVTVEPGLYFIPALLHDPKLRKKYNAVVNFDRAESYLSLGGIRIEDDVAITQTGHRNLTSVVKDIDEIEAYCLPK